MKRQRISPRVRREWSSGMREFLSSGTAIYLHLEGCAAPDDETAAAAWADLGEDILSTWVTERPGSRPAGWWRFVAQERRECTSGEHPFDNPRRKTRITELLNTYPDYAAPFYELSRGTPRCLLPPSGNFEGDFDATYEGEDEYLDRLGLLTEGEKERIGETYEHENAGENGVP